MRGGLVLLYHRVVRDGDKSPDPFLLQVTARNFAEHLEVISRHASITPLPDLIAEARQGELRPRSVALTFDDGYADNLSVAHALLQRKAAPATVFVTSGCIGGDFWWEELADLVCGPEFLPRRLRLVVNGQTVDWRVKHRGALLARLHPLVRDLDPETRRAALDELRGWSGRELARQRIGRPLTAEQLEELARSDLVEIGSHTVTHRSLGSLEPSGQEWEILQSKAQLEEWIGKPVTSFSYPFGAPRDLAGGAPARVESAGFERACSTTCDVVRRSSDRFRLPRLWVRDWNGAEFRRHLDRWLGSSKPLRSRTP